ncbi:MAG: metal-dependent phosphohydrolase [Spirochaeta sp.]|nr:metal-dependent phosphohydrolase [Spirochaeta sp.]
MASVKVVPLKEFINRHPTGLRQLLQQRENIVCRNKQSGRLKQVQLRALYQNNPTFWQKEDTWQYYLDRAVAESTAEAIRLQRETSSAWQSAGKGEIEELEAVPGDGPAETDTSAKPASNFGEIYDAYKEMPAPERVGLLQATTRKLEELAQEETKDEDAVAEALVQASENATMANRATLLEALRLGGDQAKAYTQEIVKETHRMVRSTIKLVDSAVYNDDLVKAVVEKSNGTVIQHMTRVFLSGLEFLLYYNRQVMTKGIANRIRIRFPRDYKEYYRSLLPHLHEDYITLEHGLYGGMKALNEVEINKFATGFLVHDVGKAEDIEYHEGDEGYDRSTVERHVKLGYRAVMEKTSYPREAALITGYHHEYYGHPNGYGYFREFLAEYKKANPQVSQDYVMAYTMEPLIDYEVLAYFPAKMLEIVDVFDSLTDPNRKYRSPLSEEEALELIETQFIVENHKVDPILFRLFLDFQEDRNTR